MGETEPFPQCDVLLSVFLRTRIQRSAFRSSTKANALRSQIEHLANMDLTRDHSSRFAQLTGRSGKLSFKGADNRRAAN